MDGAENGSDGSENVSNQTPWIHSSIQDASTSIEKTTDCTLCPKKYGMPCRLRRHFTQLHVSHGFNLGDKYILLCKLKCFTNEQTTRAHFHCPGCHLLFPSKDRIVSHFETKHVPKFQPDDIEPTEKGKPRIKRKCCQIVDPCEGIYMVSKNNKWLNTPVHVKHLTGTTHDIVQCSEESCFSASRVAAKQGLMNFKCQHIKHVEPQTFKKDEWQQSIDLDNLADTEQKLLEPFLKVILSSTSNIVVPWRVNDSQIYYSVLSFNSKYYSKFGRLFVKFFKDKKNTVVIAIPFA